MANRAVQAPGLAAALDEVLTAESGSWLDSSVQSAAGFCNRVLWPLLHGFPTRVRCHDHDWHAYVAANVLQARRVIELAALDATIWVHDYPLLLVARELRLLGHRGRIGLFLHTPFPTVELLDNVPWAGELIDAMAEFDLLGFQTQQFATSFVTAARLRRKRLPDIDVFPATIDAPAPRGAAGEVREVAGLRGALGEQKLLLAVDPLDYAKGIPERLAAYERLLDRYPEWQRRVSLLQIASPAWPEIGDNAELRERVEGMIGRINGRFGDTDWVPVHYLYRAFEPHVIAQLHRLADVAVVTPLRDGMNLVAKEFVAAQDATRPGVLVLSQYAGAAETLAGALITNPFHPEGMAADLDHALRMPPGERLQRHRVLASALAREGDARTWARSFLDRLAAPPLSAVATARSVS
jgi:trehalose-6-phosphate synthase